MVSLDSHVDVVIKELNPAISGARFTVVETVFVSMVSHNTVPIRPHQCALLDPQKCHIQSGTKLKKRFHYLLVLKHDFIRIVAWVFVESVLDAFNRAC